MSWTNLHQDFFFKHFIDKQIEIFERVHYGGPFKIQKQKRFEQ